MLSKTQIATAPSLFNGPLRVAWAMGLISVAVWCWATLEGFSMMLAQLYGIGLCGALSCFLVSSICRYPALLARPVNVFFIGCIYLFLFDAAILREVQDFPPEIIVAADTLAAMFLIIVIITNYCVRPRRTPWNVLLRNVPYDFSPVAYFWIAISIVVLQYVRLLCLENFSVSRFWVELLSRSGGAFRRESAGDWRVILEPIDMVFLSVFGFASLAWAGVSRSKRLILIGAVLIQLLTLIANGTRSNLLIAVLLPLFVRAAKHDRSVGRWLMAVICASFLLAPTMDLMNQTRQGWDHIGEAQNVSWNLAQAHRDDNFFWLTNLVAYRAQDSGLVSYKGAFGFVDGIEELGLQWLEIPIPRFVWANKPEWWNMHDDTRTSSVTDTVVGDLYRMGGLSFVFVGALLVGLWLSSIEPIYWQKKSDGQAVVYAFLMTATISIVRGASAINTLPIILSTVVIGGVWQMGGIVIKKHIGSTQRLNGTP